MKELIVFFSRAGENHVDGMTKYIETGNTKVAARMLREITGADMTEIIPEKPYSENYKECVAEAVRDWKKDARPKIMTDITDIKDAIQKPFWLKTAISEKQVPTKKFFP